MPGNHTSLRAWVDAHVLPRANDWENGQILPPDALDHMARTGGFGALIAEEYGGSQPDSLALGRMAADLARGSVSLLSVFVVHAMVCQAVNRFGSAAQKAALLPKMAKGELKAAFALTEPDFGSEATGISLAATRTSDGILLNGRKKWISASRYADLFLVFARFGEDGLSALLVPAATPGLTVTPLQDLLGFRAAGIAELEFSDCLVPLSLPLEGSPECLIGPGGGGFSFVASHALDTGRYIVGWGSVGIAEACLEAAVSYASERKQFGVPLRKHQLIQALIADMATEIAAARALGEKTAASRERLTPESIMDVSMFKYFGSLTASRAASNALQIHGGNGCSPDFPLQRYFRDTKLCEIIEGSSQMQQLMIANATFMSRRARRKKNHAAGM